MRYVDFAANIRDELRRSPEGLTWVALKERLELPYRIPCQTWVYRLEDDIGLVRTRSKRGMIWTLREGEEALIDGDRPQD